MSSSDVRAGQIDLSLPRVADLISRHIPLYRHRQPVYQTELLRSFRNIWTGPHARVLDVGGGTGLVGQAIKDLFDVPSVTAIDIHDRFLPSLDIATRLYDGSRMPFENGAFDAVVISNVLHHVPANARAPLMAECRRVVGKGAVYVKDHIAAGTLDHLRLAALDVIGNVPFGGMVRAQYLSRSQWVVLARESGFDIEATAPVGAYRSVAFARIFPNHLETTMRWRAL